MERETKKIITPVGKQEVIIKTYITGREKRQLMNVYLSNGIDFDLNDQKMTGFDFKIYDKAQDLAWQTVVVSIDGSTENIIEKILDMQADDYNFIVAAVNEITADKKFNEEKKTS